MESLSSRADPSLQYYHKILDVFEYSSLYFTKLYIGIINQYHKYQLLVYCLFC